MHKVVQLHHFLILERFHHPREKPQAAIPHSPFSHKPLETMHLLFVAMDLPILGTSDKRNPAIRRPWYMASFTRHGIFHVHPCCSMYANFMPFYRKINSLIWIYPILLIHLSVDGQWACFHFFAVIRVMLL